MIGRPEITAARRVEADRIIAAVARWAGPRPDLRGAAVVGSWVRGSATMASDVDVVLLAADPAPYVEEEGWWDFLGPGRLVATRRWGPLTERRVELPSGLEVEFGIAPPSWAACDPPDPGTAAVVRDGMEILHDPDRLLRSLAEAVAA